MHYQCAYRTLSSDYNTYFTAKRMLRDLLGILLSENSEGRLCILEAWYEAVHGYGHVYKASYKMVSFFFSHTGRQTSVGLMFQVYNLQLSAINIAVFVRTSWRRASGKHDWVGERKEAVKIDYYHILSFKATLSFLSPSTPSAHIHWYWIWLSICQ